MSGRRRKPESSNPKVIQGEVVGRPLVIPEDAELKILDPGPEMRSDTPIFDQLRRERFGDSSSSPLMVLDHTGKLDW